MYSEDDKTLMEFTMVQSVDALARTVAVDHLAETIHRWMHPFADTVDDSRRGILDALEGRPAPGGFVITATDAGSLAGVCVMLRTGMTGYIPPNLLLFLAVEPSRRRCGIGTLLVREALGKVTGPVKLHVESRNPARTLYEKFGFTAAYVDMRYSGTEVQL